MVLCQDDDMYHTDDSYELIDSEEINRTDDDSYEFVNSENYSRTTDSEDDSSVESNFQGNGTESSDLETDDLLNKTADDSRLEFLANIKRKEDMEIKDVVKRHVLPFLPAKSLVKFRTVSKEWDQWIVSPFLAHNQSHYFRDISGFFRQYGGDPIFMTLNRSAYGIPCPSLEFMPEPVVIRSSCNGLLLCQGKYNNYYVCNPTNKEWEVLPGSKNIYVTEAKPVLVFEPFSLNFEAHYQVICPLFEEQIIYFEIYSSETRSWELSGTDCVELDNSKPKDNGFYMKGVAYWETWSGELLAFDLKNELCGIQYLPREATTRGILSQIDGELCYIQARYEDGNAFIVDVYGGINMCSKRSIPIDLELAEGVAGEYCRVLACVNSDVLAVLIRGVVYSYNVRDQKVEVISREGNDSRARYIPYVNSLVSLACK